MIHDKIDNFKGHYENHITQKIKGELYDRYMMAESWDEIERQINNSLKRLSIPYMDFSLTTNCTLRCKDCTQWAPYIRNKRIYSVDEIHKWLEAIFRVVDECIFITMLGGELFLHPQIYEVLKLFIEYKNKGKIQYLRIVTNGTIVPSVETLQLCADNNIYILISDYSNVFNKKMEENREMLLKKLDDYRCKYYFGKDASWIDLGIPNKEHFMLAAEQIEEDERVKRFNNCFIRDCVACFEGKLYRCPRVYVAESNKWCAVNENEVIDFNKIDDKDNLKIKMKQFYSLTSLKTCALCNEVKFRKQIEPAIQLEDIRV